MKININYLSESIIVEVEPSALIIDIKKKIREKKNFPVESQNLIKGNLLLKDENNLTNYEIIENSVLRLYISAFIFVKRPEKDPMSYKIDFSDTIKNLKERIKEKEDASISHQALYLNIKDVETNKELNDEKTIDDYNIKRGDTILLLYKSKGGFQIFIKENNHKNYIINANLEDKIRNIKEMIIVKLSPELIQFNRKIYINEIVLKYGAYIMRENEKTLMDYNVQRNGTIYVNI